MTNLFYHPCTSSKTGVENGHPAGIRLRPIQWKKKSWTHTTIYTADVLL